MRLRGLICPRCGSRFPATDFARECSSCGPDVPVGLTVEYVSPWPTRPSRESLARGPSSLWRYDHSLPVASADAVSLGEGQTPLVKMPSIGAGIGLSNLYAKCEFVNPTGSFKDRLATVAISGARSLFRAKVIASSSTGNAGAAVAAYAARASMPCVIFTVAGADSPMVWQMRAAGAVIVTVATKADRWRLMSEGVEQLNWFPTSPFFGPPVGSNPFGIEGYKSLAYEIAEAFEWSPPEWIVLPICYGDALFGMWRGFVELIDFGIITAMPRFVGAEIYGSLSAAFAMNIDVVPLAEQTHRTAATSISALQSTYQAVATLRNTNGLPVIVSEPELLDCAGRLSAKEGLYVEPAAAASMAAAIRLRHEGTIQEADRVVCVLTSGGLKDPAFQGGISFDAVSGETGLAAILKRVKEQRGLDLEEGSR